MPGSSARASEVITIDPNVPDSGHQNTAAALQILLVCVDDQLERTVRDSGVAVEAVRDGEAAVARLRERPFDAVICHVRDTDAVDHVDRVLQWLASHTPSTHAIVRAGEQLEALQQTYALAPNLRFVEASTTDDALAKTVHELGPRRGFFGSAIEVELFDYVQMIALTGRDKLIEVVTPRGVGLIWFEHGDIVHAQYDQFRGETAFYKLLSVGRGAFREIVNRVPPMRTVTRSSTHLLMEAARQQDEGILGKVGDKATPAEDDHETSFSDLNEPEGEGPPKPAAAKPAAAKPAAAKPVAAKPVAAKPAPKPKPGPLAPPKLQRAKPAAPLRPMASDDEDADFAALVEDSLVEVAKDVPRGESSNPFALKQPGMVEEPLQVEDSAGHVLDPAESQAAMSTVAGHAIFDDPDMRAVMLEQFWQFEGINGVAIISSTGKVLAEDMRSNSSLVTLAGFYMRGAARIARTLGYNVFDGVVARSVNGQQMVMVSMGAASAVLSVEEGADPEAVRDAVMGVE